MLVMGSQAAKLRGDLPAWSSPHLTDYDLVGSRDEFLALRDQSTAAGLIAIAHDRGNGRYGLRVAPEDNFADRVLIDWVSDEIASSRLLLALPDHAEGVILGRPCLVVSAQTELAMKRAILPYQADPAKTAAWIEHWETVVGDTPASPELEAFVGQLVAEYESFRVN